MAVPLKSPNPQSPIPNPQSPAPNQPPIHGRISTPVLAVFAGRPDGGERGELSTDGAAIHGAASAALPPSPTLEQVIAVVNGNSSRIQSFVGQLRHDHGRRRPDASRQPGDGAAPPASASGGDDVDRSRGRPGQQRRVVLVLDPPRSAKRRVLLPARSICPEQRPADGPHRAGGPGRGVGAGGVRSGLAAPGARDAIRRPVGDPDDSRDGPRPVDPGDRHRSGDRLGPRTTHV